MGKRNKSNTYKKKSTPDEDFNLEDNKKSKSKTKTHKDKIKKKESLGNDDKCENVDSPMLASVYDGSQEIQNWYMSEKLDGIRAIWDGKHLHSRYGNKFYPPEFFIQKFTKDVVLDGELFLDRKSFSETASIVKKHTAHDGWKKIKYIVFDGPELRGDFKTRYKELEKIVKECKSQFLELLPQEVCKDKTQLDEKMKSISALGGEGLMLKDPHSRYEFKRSKKLLKVKEFQDSEATVIGILKGTGRLSHLMGSLQVRNKEGIEFKIGTGFTDQQRAKPPKVGSVVTYRYFELSKDKVPRFPSFIRSHPGV